MFISIPSTRIILLQVDLTSRRIYLDGWNFAPLSFLFLKKRESRIYLGGTVVPCYNSWELKLAPAP
jgi:hypothetical protein